MFNLFRGSKCDKRPLVLLVLDGFGVAPPSEGNAIYRAKTPTYERMAKMYPYTELIASGESVGLPANEVGNTEVGHLTIGAGRTIDQDLVRIKKAIEDESFYTNPALVQAIEHTRQYGGKLHLMGLASSGNVHASLRHLYALMELLKRQEVYGYFHLFLDGRDANPQEGAQVIGQVQQRLAQQQVGAIASLAGRYYAMDRDRRWERTQLTYQAVVEGQGVVASDPVETIKASYQQGETDEFVKPTVLTDGTNALPRIGDNDAVIFYNFRVDRPKQLAAALAVPHFENLRNFAFTGTAADKAAIEFESTFERRVKPRNLLVVTMTEYQEGMPVGAVAFAPERVTNGLSQVLVAHGLTQLRMAESEKERFVTYYINGMIEESMPGVTVRIEQSPRVPTYDLKPEMSVFNLVKTFEREMRLCAHDVAILNFANPDMVAHTGNIEATIKALEHVDKALSRMEKTVLGMDGMLMVTADHGNAEELLSFPQTSFFYTTSEGGVNTEHSNNKVPLVFASKQLAGKPVRLKDGTLGDIAPTMLRYLGIEPPVEMTGRDILAELGQEPGEARPGEASGGD